jgi:drug/metabolite transporter (DMT)-like permease
VRWLPGADGPFGMTINAFLFLFAGVLLNATAQLLLKGGTNRLGVITLTAGNWMTTLTRMASEGYFIAGVVFYGVSLIVWIMGLSRVPVSIAYPMLSLGYIVNAVAAHYLFGEAVTVQRWLGIGFIVVGVYLVARSA